MTTTVNNPTPSTPPAAATEQPNPLGIPLPKLRHRPSVTDTRDWPAVMEAWHNEHHRFGFDHCTEDPCRDLHRVQLCHRNHGGYAS